MNTSKSLQFVMEYPNYQARCWDDSLAGKGTYFYVEFMFVITALAAFASRELVMTNLFYLYSPHKCLRDSCL